MQETVLVVANAADVLSVLLGNFLVRVRRPAFTRLEGNDLEEDGVRSRQQLQTPNERYNVCHHPEDREKQNPETKHSRDNPIEQ
jgi:hypothetical protein